MSRLFGNVVDSLIKIDAIAKQAARDPVRFGEARDALIREVRRAIQATSAWGRKPNYTLDVVPDMIVDLDSTSSIAAGMTNSISVRWPADGVVCCLMGGERAATPDPGSISVRIQIEGKEDLFVSATGSGGASLSYQQLFAQGSALPWCPIAKRVRIGESWTVTFTNRHAANAKTPLLSFGLKTDD